MRAWTWALIAGVVSLLSWGGCSDDAETSPTTTSGSGATSGTTVATTSTMTTASTGSGMPCAGPPDDFCDVEMGEDCSCADCVPTGLCTPGACVTDDDGFCDPDLDSCVCADCDVDYNCSDPADYNCADDGRCDQLNGTNLGEGCNCADCFMHALCTDNVAACEGGAADDVCNLPTEDCACVDCLGALGCDPCTPDDTCDYAESCLCVDCLDEAFCMDPMNCEDDTICAPLYEGCHCTDCAGTPACGAGGAGGN